MSRLSFARVSFVMMFVAMVLPCGHFLSTICLSGMRRLRHWLVPFGPPYEAVGLRRRERPRRARRRIGAEIVLNQDDPLSVGKRFARRRPGSSLN